MKKVFLTLGTVALAFSMNAQKLSTIDVYDSQININVQKKKFKTKVIITDSIQISDGFSIAVGDTLTVGESVSKISTAYRFLISGRYTTADALMGSKPYLAGINVKGSKVIITKLFARRAMGVVSINADLKLVGVGEGLLNIKYLTTWNFKKAVELGELLSDNRPMDRSQAIEKLREAKELFDLDMLSKDEFDAIKLEVMPIIKNK